MYVLASLSERTNRSMAARFRPAHDPWATQKLVARGSEIGENGSPIETKPSRLRLVAKGSSASTASRRPALSWSGRFGDGASTPLIEPGSTPFFLAAYRTPAWMTPLRVGEPTVLPRSWATSVMPEAAG